MIETSNATVLSDRYELLEVLGRGTTAEVFRATDLLLVRQVAVKVYRFGTDAAVERARVAELIRLLASLRHPGLVGVLDGGVGDSEDPHADQPYLVMELIRGPSLRQRLTAGALSPDETRGIGIALAAALAHVHSAGAVHGDVRPANVLLDASSDDFGSFNTKLTGFGIVRSSAGGQASDCGPTGGAADCAGPEHITGGPAGSPADIHSLGLVLIECLTGHTVDPGDGTEAVAGRPDSALGSSDGDGRWVDLLQAMTARDPQTRPTAQEVEAALERLRPTPADDAARASESFVGLESLLKHDAATTPAPRTPAPRHRAPRRSGRFAVLMQALLK